MSNNYDDRHAEDIAWTAMHERVPHRMREYVDDLKRLAWQAKKNYVSGNDVSNETFWLHLHLMTGEARWAARVLNQLLGPIDHGGVVVGLRPQRTHVAHPFVVAYVLDWCMRAPDRRARKQRVAQVLTVDRLVRRDDGVGTSTALVQLCQRRD